MTEFWEWIILAGMVGFLCGMPIGKMMEAYHWRSKANPDYRTAMCSRGQFFYVMPESEYVQRHMATREGP